jgi:hypothetical protein
MDKSIQVDFIDKWNKYFPSAELPIGYYYTDYISERENSSEFNQQRCLIANLKRVREGEVFIYDANSPGCSGGKTDFPSRCDRILNISFPVEFPDRWKENVIKSLRSW